MKNYCLYSCLFLLLFSCGKVQKSTNMTFMPIDVLTRTSIKIINGDTLNSKSEDYLILNYVKDDSTEIILDKFLCEKVNDYKPMYDIYLVTFFKESKTTNLKSLAEDIAIIDMYSLTSDLVGSYGWQKKHGVAIKQIDKKRSQLQKYIWGGRGELDRLEEIVCY